jgi:uncharacterized RDD family membrane protein YckC
MADYADSGKRIVAVIIDHIIISVIMVLLALPLGLHALFFSPLAMAGDATLAASLMASIATYSVLGIVVFLAYFTYFEGTTGQTPGKKLLNIKVVKEKGEVTYTDALVRNLLRIVDGIFLYLVGFIVLISNEKKQRIGDMAAHTLVVKA